MDNSTAVFFADIDFAEHQMREWAKQNPSRARILQFMMNESAVMADAGDETWVKIHSDAEELFFDWSGGAATWGTYRPNDDVFTCAFISAFPMGDK